MRERLVRTARKQNVLSFCFADREGKKRRILKRLEPPIGQRTSSTHRETKQKQLQSLLVDDSVEITKNRIRVRKDEEREGEQMPID